MVQKVTLDAMIRREDFARELEGSPAPRIGNELKLGDLLPSSAIRRQLRKPEFQRETNYWSPPQILKFLSSFVDGGVIPSIILWRSTNFVFVIDGAHRLSALCAWIADDWGDETESKNFFSDEITNEQNRIAVRTRAMVKKEIGKYADLDRLVGKVATDRSGIRAGAMNTRPIVVQTVDGDAEVAEDSFFAINTQGTIFLRNGVKKILECPICGGFLDVEKSVSYDHIKPIREGGLGEAENGQMVHPYCNSIKG